MAAELGAIAGCTILEKSGEEDSRVEGRGSTRRRTSVVCLGRKGLEANVRPPPLTYSPAQCSIDTLPAAFPAPTVASCTVLYYV
jgi:hypothetical protein